MIKRGRPSRNEDPKVVRINLKLTEEEAEKLEYIANSTGLNRTEVIVDLINSRDKIERLKLLMKGLDE